jgi:putative ABC transport system permease protein
VTASNLAPGMENTNAIGIRAERGSESGAGINFLVVDLDFFETYGIEVLAGRAFSDQFADRILGASAGGPRAGTYVVSERLARRWGWSADEALGKWLEIAENGAPGQTRGTIVGVVKDVYFESIRNAIEPTLYVLPPVGVPQVPETLRYASLRLSGSNLEGTLRAIDRKWAELVPDQPMARHFLDQDFEALYQSERRQGQMFTFFSALAILIACLGLFGLAAFTTERRTKEIGIRKAVGGGVLDIVGMFCGEFGKLVLVANLIAWPAAYFLMLRWLSSFAYRVDMSLWVYVASAAAALAIATATVGAVAARAASAKPVHALRYE